MILPSFWDDLKDAVRRIRRNFRTSLIAIGTLALGIGAATAILTVAHSFLLAPPPFRQPDRIVRIHGPRNPQYTNVYQGVSGPDLLDWLKEPNLFDSATLVFYGEFTWTGQSLPGFDGAEVLRGHYVTPDYFRVMDHPMAVGRGFLPEEQDAVVISYGLWQRRFAGRSDVVGQTVVLNQKPHTIVGVAGRGFLTYDRYEVAAWVPFSAASGPRASHQSACYARLVPGITLAQAQQRLEVLSRHLAEAYPDTNSGYMAKADPFLSADRAEMRPAMLALVGAVLCLLLIASANVASILLARATMQSREMSIRVALGAGRIRLYRMMIAESLLLALLAGTAGAAIGAFLISFLRTQLPVSFAMGWAFTIDWRIFAAAFLVSTLAGLTAGLAPAFQTFRLAAGDVRTTVSRSRLMRAIVTAEVALAVVLSIGGGLLAKSFLQLVNRPLGYRTDSLLGMRVRVVGDRYKSFEQRAIYWDELAKRAENLPGVAKAAVVSDLPMGWQYIGNTFEVFGKPVAPGQNGPRAHQIAASPGYFATLAIPIVAGRAFTESDGPQSEPVVIVNDLLAQNIWPGEDPIGKQIKAMDRKSWRRVVGVARSIRHGGPNDEYENQLYVPYRQGNITTMFLVLRTQIAPESVIPSVRAALKSIDPDLPAFEIRTLKAAFERETAIPRLPMLLTTGFAGLAAFLAALGLFGVIAYWVSQRRKELAIRSAIGARPFELTSLVVGQGLRMAIIGLLVGVATSFAVMRYIRSLLYGMSERDGLIYISAIVLTLSVALLACLLPAGRAARINPAEVLHEDG